MIFSGLSLAGARLICFRYRYNTDLEVNAIGREVPLPDLPIGPTINGVIDCRDQENFLDGFVIEEGAVPGGVASIFQSMLQSTPGKIDSQNFGLQERLRHLVSLSKSRLLGPYVQDGSVERTQIYLIMSHDDNQAILSLKDDKPHLQFLGVGRSDHVQHLNHVLAEATSKIGGTYINSPFYALLGQDEVCSCPLSRDTNTIFRTYSCPDHSSRYWWCQYE